MNLIKIYREKKIIFNNILFKLVYHLRYSANQPNFKSSGNMAK